MIIQNYLHRRNDLDPRARIKTAIRISERIYQKAGLIPIPGQTDDDFLESLARQMRDNAILRGNSNS